MSDFKRLFEDQEEEEVPAAKITTPKQPIPAKQLAPPTIEAPKRGRAKGKRSDPSYTQVGAYIPKELDKAVKRKLLDTDQDFSDLVADLLVKWLSD